MGLWAVPLFESLLFSFFKRMGFSSLFNSRQAYENSQRAKAHKLHLKPRRGRSPNNIAGQKKLYPLDYCTQIIIRSKQPFVSIGPCRRSGGMHAYTWSMNTSNLSFSYFSPVIYSPSVSPSVSLSVNGAF